MTADLRTWNLHAERPARPGERTSTGEPAAYLGFTIGHLRRYLLDPDLVGDVAHYFGHLQRSAAEYLRCGIDELTWYGSLNRTDQEIAELVAKLVPADAAVVIERIP